MDFDSISSRHPLALIIASSLLCVLTVGCSTDKGKETQASTASTTTIGQVFEEAIQLPAQPNSTVRIGDKVTYMVIWQNEQNERYLLRFDAYCNQEKAWMHYPSRRGMTHFTSDNPDRSLSLEQTRRLMNNAAFKTACSQTHADDWRVVSQEDNEDWLIIDRNNLKTEGSVRHAWLGHDYLHKRLNAGKTTTTAQTRAQVTVDCTQQTLNHVSQYDMTADNNVLSGALYTEPEAGNLSAAQKKRFLDAVCQSENTLANLPKLQDRAKLAPLIAAPEVAPNVIDAIKTLNLPAPRKPLKQLNFSYDVKVLGKDIRDQKRQWLISTDTRSNQALIRPVDVTLKDKVELTFRGLTTLEYNNVLPKDKPVQRLQDISFEGDWRYLPPQAKISYSKTTHSNKTPRAEDFTRTVECQVAEPVQASTLNAALQGLAKPLTCDESAKRSNLQWTKSYWYLEDYGLFIPASETGPMGQWQWRVDSVQ